MQASWLCTCLLYTSKKQYSDYPAISDKVTTYTYEELVSRVAKRVTFINSLGLEKGSNIAVLAKNDLDAMELFLAIPAAGHVLIMLPNALNDKALAGISMKFDPVSYTHLEKQEKDLQLLHQRFRSFHHNLTAQQVRFRRLLQISRMIRKKHLRL